MELMVRDRLEGCEYSSDFTDYEHRYVLEKVIKREEDRIAVIALGYSSQREDFGYIVKAVNSYERLKHENETLTKEQFADLMECKEEAIKQLESENIKLTEFSVKKRAFELYRNKEKEINKDEVY